MTENDAIDLKMKLYEVDKRVAELEWRNRNLEAKDIREVLLMMKEFGVQTFRLGGLDIQLQYQHAPLSSEYKVSR